MTEVRCEDTERLTFGFDGLGFFNVAA